MHRQHVERNILDDDVERRVEELSREIGLTPSELVREAVEEYASSPRRLGRFVETKLARELRAIRRRIVRNGAPLFDADGVTREIAERRGERWE